MKLTLEAMKALRDAIEAEYGEFNEEASMAYDGLLGRIVKISVPVSKLQYAIAIPMYNRVRAKEISARATSKPTSVPGPVELIRDNFTAPWRLKDVL